MLVQAKNGRFYTKDHPHEIIREGVMRFDEIRFWMRELSTNLEYGWAPRGVKGLERALGMNAATLAAKLTVSWIWPREQVRLTKRIEAIRAGYIVPRRLGYKRVEGVWTDPPQPPTLKEKRILRLTVGIHGVKQGAPLKPLGLPSFATIFQNAHPWDPDNDRPSLFERGLRKAKHR